MTVVPHDETFEEKVNVGARAILQDRMNRGLRVGHEPEWEQARNEARAVLLAAKAVDARS